MLRKLSKTFLGKNNKPPLLRFISYCKLDSYQTLWAQRWLIWWRRERSQWHSFQQVFRDQLSHLANACTNKPFFRARRTQDLYCKSQEEESLQAFHCTVGEPVLHPALYETKSSFLSSLRAMTPFCNKHTKAEQCHLLTELPAQTALIFPKTNLLYSATFKQNTLLELRLCPPAGSGYTIAHILPSEQTSWIPNPIPNSHTMLFNFPVFQKTENRFLHLFLHFLTYVMIKWLFCSFCHCFETEDHRSSDTLGSWCWVDRLSLVQQFQPTYQIPSSRLLHWQISRCIGDCSLRRLISVCCPWPSLQDFHFFSRWSLWVCRVLVGFLMYLSVFFFQESRCPQAD